MSDGVNEPLCYLFSTSLLPHLEFFVFYFFQRDVFFFFFPINRVNNNSFFMVLWPVLCLTV